MRPLWMLLVLVGCSDDAIETTWTMQLAYDADACNMSDEPKLWLIDRDGDFESAFDQGGRRMTVDATSDSNYTVTLAANQLSAVLQVHLTPSAEGVFTLDGVGTLDDSSGSSPCHDTFSFTGTSFPEDVGCGQQEEDCAAVLGWEWHSR